LNYLYNTNPAKAQEMIKALNIRFRPTGKLGDDSEKYSKFKNTKTVFKKERVRV